MNSNILQLDKFEQRFHSLFQEAPFSAALLSGDELQVEMANAVSLQLWGKDKSILGKPLLEAMPEMHDQEVYKILRKVYQSGETYEGKEQAAYLQKEGELKKVFVNLVYKAIKDNTGKVTGVFAVGYDVTDQVIAREKLQQSDTIARVAIESTDLGTFELNYRTGATTSSRRFDEIFGFDRSAGHHEYVSRIHPDDLEVRSKAHKNALHTGKLRYEARILIPDKPMRWIKVNGSVIFDEGHSPHLLIGTALDITEEKLSLEKLRESEERFRTLISETTEVGVGLYVGNDFTIRYVNDVMLRFWHKSNKVVGKTWREALPELDGQPFLQQMSDVYATGIPFSGQEVQATQDRNGTLEIGYYNYTFKALKNLDDEIYAIHHIAVDVSDQVKNKLKLIESEKGVRNLFEQTPVGLALFKGRDFTVELINETLLRYWRRSREDVIGKPVFEALPELAGQGIREIAEDVYRTGEPYTSPDTPVTLLRDGNPDTIIVRFGFQAMKDWHGEIIGLLAIANEVTDLVTSRQKVEKNEMRLKFLADSMPQVVWMAEHDGTVSYYNKRVLQFAGVQQNDDGSWVWQGIVHPEDRDITRQTWSKAVATLRPYEIEHRIMMKDGSFRWHLSRAYAYQTDEGTKWYGTATDVHDQKVLEMNLESLVRERTLELQRSNDDLQQFAHVASHDLKEPVRKIKTFSYKLQEEYKQVLGDRGNTFVNKIINASDRMNSMINGVLNYASMPTSGAATERIDLSVVIDSVQTDLEVLIQERNASITCRNLPVIVGIKHLIHQLFYNLLNNALKFAKSDVSSAVVISCDEIEILQKNYYDISVEDNGIGFDQDHAEQIFTSFVRLNAKDKYEGNGLGLALCKKIIERHGGMITAKGEKNKGATFHVMFPK